MENTMKNMLLAASLAALTIPVGAQGTAADPMLPARKAAVQPSQQHQKKRIAHTAHSGKVAAGEAASLEKKEANGEERDMREDNRGRLTTAARAKIHHHQTQVTKSANSKKHNATVASAKAKSGAGLRAKTQPPASAQLKTGQLTRSQARHLETKETSLRRDIHSDREETGGRSKSAEDQTKQPPNKSTHEIHLKKHNARMF